MNELLYFWIRDAWLIWPREHELASVTRQAVAHHCHVKNFEYLGLYKAK
jgi:hypothetical protein